MAVAIVATLLTVAPSVNATAARGSDPPRPSIVMVRSDTDPRAVARSVGAAPRHAYTSALRGFAASLTGSQRRRLGGDERVLSVTEDGVSRHGRPQSTAWRRGSSTQIIPSGTERVGALDSPTANINGEDEPIDADVAVLDSGVAEHPDLRRAGGTDCVSGGSFDDHDGHGTMVAGIIGAKDNGQGIVGVAPGVRIWAVRVTDPRGKITDSSFLCGLDWVHQHAAEIDVVNMSFSGPGVDTGTCGVADHGIVDPFHAAICALVQTGVVAVASAGNESVDAASWTPAAFPEVITVSAFADTDGRRGGQGRPARCAGGPTFADDRFARFSNFGAPIDVSAPGVCIVSTFPTGIPGTAGACDQGCYGRATGTSFATPHVAGAAALLMARHPDWTPGQVRQHLIETAEPGPIPGDPDSFPEGVLNVRGY
jgi:subtilisin